MLSFNHSNDLDNPRSHRQAGPIKILVSARVRLRDSAGLTPAEIFQKRLRDCGSTFKCSVLAGCDQVPTFLTQGIFQVSEGMEPAANVFNSLLPLPFASSAASFFGSPFSAAVSCRSATAAAR